MSLNLNDIITHIRDRGYMTGVQRTHARVKSTGEVFTPTELVREMLDQIPIEKFEDPAKTFLDPSCGDGQFLGEVLIRKLEYLKDENNNITDEQFKSVLESIYGIDLMTDNVKETHKRLLCNSKKKQFKQIVTRNIICRSGLDYDYSFNGTPYTNKELEEQQQVLLGIVPEKAPSKIKKTKKTTSANSNFNTIFSPAPNKLFG